MDPAEIPHAQRRISWPKNEPVKVQIGLNPTAVSPKELALEERHAVLHRLEMLRLIAQAVLPATGGAIAHVALEEHCPASGTLVLTTQWAGVEQVWELHSDDLLDLDDVTFAVAEQTSQPAA
jgi:hypothetical protein